MKSIYASVSFILAASAAWGAAPAADQILVQVNGTPIRRSELVSRLLGRYGAQTVDEMIDELLMRQAAQKGAITADEAAINRRVTKLQERFGSRELFLSQLEQAGSSVAKLKFDLADEIVREKLVVKAKALKVTDEELKKAFDANKDGLGQPEAVHLRHILVKTQAEADTVAEKVKSGADFAALARDKSLAASGKSAGGDYGFVARGMLPDEIEKIAFGMKAGELKTVPGARGVHVLQVLDRRPAKVAVFGEVKEDLREMLLQEKIKKAAPEYLSDLRRAADIKAAATDAAH
jgi:foldase protein PrsA